jgi:N6-adenosine-specific RNA methylase IME4/ParB-like chromosome segregation protein Spo0J
VSRRRSRTRRRQRRDIPATEVARDRRHQSRHQELEFHPLANIFPLLEGAEFDKLVADITAHGLREPITLYHDQILDGRNRYRACIAAGIEPTFKTYEGTDPVAYVVSLNIKRRHLDESQRGMVAAKLATLRDGQRADLVEGLPIVRASDLLNVGERTVARAREVLDHGAPELIHAVEQGKIAVSAGASLAQKEPEHQRAVVEKVLEGAKTREAERTVRNSGIAARVAALPSGKYRVIYCDPPLRYSDDRAGLDCASTAAEDHYPTMSVAELCALDVGSLAADDSVLLCWATYPLRSDALEVVRAWGFTYKTSFVWDKGRGSLGHYHKAEAEELFVCTRGSCTPDSDVRENQIQRFPRGKHSAKPEEWRALIDRQWPHGPRIELFRRGDVPAGWTAWGNQLEQGRVRGASRSPRLSTRGRRRRRTAQNKIRRNSRRIAGI